MKYFKISNKGELDVRLVALMGGTTKANDNNKIGQFGTGLKYAISYLIRTDNKFRLFIGEKEVTFSGKDEVISGQEFKEIYCNGKSMNITTRYGYQWKAWEVIREIWCNAKDEGKEQKKVTSDGSIISGTKGRTTFFIEHTKEIEEVIANWDSYFLAEKPIFEDENVGIYLNPGKIMKIYKNRVLIHTDNHYKSLFIYDFKHANLNELRQYQGHVQGDIGRSILSSNKEVADLFIRDIQEHSKRSVNNPFIEGKIEWTYISYKAEIVRDIFQGFLFLHPRSSASKNSKSVMVTESFFNLLSECLLPCEQIATRSGGYYGGGGYGYREAEKASYKEVSNLSLKDRIQEILFKYKSHIKFTIAVPRDSDFEMLVTDDSVVFSSDLDNLSYSDLEATVLIAVFHKNEGNLFKALKRLIKFARQNKSFEKILFGH